MVTHDVDEAILLSDRVVLMTNGPNARIGEIIEIDIPRPRERTTIIDHPHYYKIRNHIMHFLVERSQKMSGAANPDTELESAEDGPRVVHFREEISPGTEPKLRATGQLRKVQ